MKKYAILAAAIFLVNVTTAQTSEKFDSKFIYEKLADIYHTSLNVDVETYFSKFGFQLISDKDLPNGDIMHRAVGGDPAGIDYFKMTKDEVINGKGDKEFSFTTHSLSNKIYTTVESRYSTSSHKEYKDFMNYIKSVGYKLLPDESSKETQTYQLNKLLVVFEKSKGDAPRPYKIIYSIKAN